ncbi:hypothetical protein CY34DRAFT_807323 [Suillus luteus UH-Slu-Lm8-n1]|uniref:Unplaced genomic scaffold CY34scaffold_175, whole genome shotgun sequence n=1 Tax=Suillus luteus UH-Slu-Lm8-n1 TaxID=930992 RepID=A0A0D0AQJ0_9AGAM|nr:hypothetical protein CY34DRAFT_807323 [Suillus luteus UH-Slu-Lm8-n1]
MNEEVDEWVWVLMTTEGEESKQKMVSHFVMTNCKLAWCGMDGFRKNLTCTN